MGQRPAANELFGLVGTAVRTPQFACTPEIPVTAGAIITPVGGIPSRADRPAIFAVIEIVDPVAVRM